MVFNLKKRFVANTQGNDISYMLLCKTLFHYLINKISMLSNIIIDA